MVIKPQQIAEKNFRLNRQKIRALEMKIDATLTRDFKPDDINGVCIDLSEYVNYNSPIYRAIKEKYEKAGWKVEYESDQRDGDFVRFRAAGRRQI